MQHLLRLFDGITMYRLVLWSLGALAAGAFGLSFFHLVAAGPDQIALSLVVLVLVCGVSNRVFAKVFRVSEGQDSSIITALLLLLIMQPVAGTDLAGLGGLGFVGLWATASKYLIAVRGKHVFNPAALGAVLTAVLLSQAASWWAASSIYLLPLTIVAGLLIGQKLRRFDLIAMLLGAHAVGVVVTSLGGDIGGALTESLLRSPLVFLAVFMATEPHTAPQQRWARLAYGAGIGALLAPGIHLGSYYPTPEQVLLAGNLFAFVVGAPRRYRLSFVRQEPVGANTIEFAFRPDRPLRFKAGQYMEWVLDARDPDTRGNRRYFTIASSPTEPEVRLGVKFYAEPSAFKRSLLALKPGDCITGTQLAGGFVLPRSKSRKLAFVAGGVGITPFRSMLRYLIDKGEARDVTVLYGNGSAAEIAYRDLLEEATRALGVKVAHALLEDDGTLPAHKGVIDEAMIRHEVPDFAERLFYVSGPPAMVNAVRRILRRIGVPASRIMLDFFPGLG